MDDLKRFCNTCGAPLEGGEMFCTACGTPVDTSQPLGMPPLSQPVGGPRPPAQPYGYGPPKKSKALPITLGVLGGVAVLIILLILLAGIGGSGSSSGTGSSTGPLYSLQDYEGAWQVQSVDGEEIVDGQIVNAWIESNKLHMSTEGDSIIFELELQKDGSLRGMAYPAEGAASVVVATLINDSMTMRLVADPDGQPSIALLRRYIQ
jgi:hypothetical protein